eukprot:13052760-Alexandrium_andersonii.AAC.2
MMTLMLVVMVGRAMAMIEMLLACCTDGYGIVDREDNGDNEDAGNGPTGEYTDALHGDDGADGGDGGGGSGDDEDAMMARVLRTTLVIKVVLFAVANVT